MIVSAGKDIHVQIFRLDQNGDAPLQIETRNQPVATVSEVKVYSG
jgi:hypothetical protein